ncbi:suppressor of cytokine signaling 6b [Electrophorus electricus]|uniref:Suppressor of cytokine signaling 6 n=1 Tax=Electrophorus electricus TaxID=8005 RepID=A0A4W4HNK3_ELEEL|nr:suppressor of cytokine signaling 6b [Electrophorus electricus]
MKKITFKTIRKSLNIKGKEENECAVSQPDLSAHFPGEESLYGGCYSKELIGCDLDGEEVKGSKSRPKSESLMGTLKRRLSTKQKPKVKGSSPSVCSLEDDTFSSSSAPITFNDLKSQHSSRSLRSHHYSPTPWPLRPTNSEETCIKIGGNVKPLINSSGSSPALNGIRKDLLELQQDNLFEETSSSLKGPDPHVDDLHLEMDDHVPVVIGLSAQDYIQYTMPLDDRIYPEEGPRSFCLDGTSPMDVVPQTDGCSLPVDEVPVDHDLLSPDIFMEPSVNRILLTTANALLHGSRLDAPLSPLLTPLPGGRLPRNLSEFNGTHTQVAESVIHHLSFDPSSAPGVRRVYDAVQNSGPMVVTSLTVELKKLAKQGWYWGPITRWEAEEKLVNLPDGSFLVRDSSDERYLLSLSFRSQGKTLHTRIEHSNGSFSFYEQPDVEGHTSIVDLIDNSIRDSENGAFCYSRSRLPGSATYPVRLTNPVSRFMQVRSLQYLCRFVIRQYTRIDLIQKLPLPNKMKDYLQEKHY